MLDQEKGDKQLGPVRGSWATVVQKLLSFSVHSRPQDVTYAVRPFEVFFKDPGSPQL